MEDREKVQISPLVSVCHDEGGNVWDRTWNGLITVAHLHCGVSLLKSKWRARSSFVCSSMLAQIGSKVLRLDFYGAFSHLCLFSGVDFVRFMWAGLNTAIGLECRPKRPRGDSFEEVVFVRSQTNGHCGNSSQIKPTFFSCFEAMCDL